MPRTGEDLRSSIRCRLRQRLRLVDGKEGIVLADAHEQALGVVTEPAGGAWLGELAPRGAALPTATAVTIVDGLLAAVEVAHAAGIAHAAICPEVVALTSSGHVRLDGFAVAATLPAGASPSLAPLEFTAPEVREKPYRVCPAGRTRRVRLFVGPGGAAAAGFPTFGLKSTSAARVPGLNHI